jgi:fatty acid desaturase
VGDKTLWVRTTIFRRRNRKKDFMPVIALILACAAIIAFGIATVRGSTKNTMAWVPFGLTCFAAALTLTFCTAFHVIHF